MSTQDPSDYKTGNAVPSNTAKDLNDNAKVFDAISNAQIPSVKSRLGVDIKTIWQQGQEFDRNVENWNNTFQAQFTYKYIKSFTEANAAGEKITDATRLNAYSVGTAPDIEWYGLIQSTIIPVDGLDIPSSPDDNWTPVDAVKLTQMRKDSASQLGLVYDSDYFSGIIIPDNAMTNKLAYWHNGQFYSVGTDTGFTSNDFDADFSSGKFVDKRIFDEYKTFKTEKSLIARSLEMRFYDVLSVKDWCKGSGVDDDTSGLIAMMTEAQAQSSVVIATHPWRGAIDFGVGSYIVSDTIPVPRGVLIYGLNAKTTQLCSITYTGTENKPIFDLYGFQQPNGKRVADQTIRGIHFKSENGHAIRCLKSDYPGEAVSYGSIQIQDCHFLNINGDYAIFADYIELVRGNTFDYCQVGHIHAQTICMMDGNEVFRGVGGSILLDSDLDTTTSIVFGSVFGVNNWKENGTASGASDSAITYQGSRKFEAITLTGGEFYGTVTGGLIGVRGNAPVGILNISGSTVNALKSSFIIDGDVDNLSITANAIANTTGTGTSFPNVIYSGKSTTCIISNNSFANTSNDDDIKVTNGSDNTFIIDNATEKVSVPAVCNYRLSRADRFEEKNSREKRVILPSSEPSNAGITYYQNNGKVIARIHPEGTGGSTTWNNNPAVWFVNKNVTNNRSINAGGTVNASGADYAEYMTKSINCGQINAGDIVGINLDGQITDIFDEAIKFAVKSTNPSLVGGDDWFNDQLPEEASEKEIAMFEYRMEHARHWVDRIAFCGQVPVNAVANVGQYMVPVKIGDGKIGCIAIDEEKMTLNQYVKSIGQVIKINSKNQPVIIVKM